VGEHESDASLRSDVGAKDESADHGDVAQCHGGRGELYLQRFHGIALFAAGHPAGECADAGCLHNKQGGVQLAPDAADPYDTSNFPASQYAYAFETFGNNGTTPHGSQPTNAANHSLDDLATTVPNAATVYADLVLTGSGSTFTGSDHYPIVGDYNIVPPPVALSAQGFVTAGNFQLKVSSVPSVGFGIQVSTDLASWTSIGSGTTDTNGALIFQDTNAGGFSKRFYRVTWPSP
jgi:hypothetical protein